MHGNRHLNDASKSSSAHMHEKHSMANLIAFVCDPIAKFYNWVIRCRQSVGGYNFIYIYKSHHLRGYFAGAFIIKIGCHSCIRCQEVRRM